MSVPTRSSGYTPARGASPRRTTARIGAAGLIAAGALWVVEGVTDALAPGYPFEHVLGPAVVLIAAGYIGYAAVQNERTGRLGVAGMVLLLAGLAGDFSYKLGAVPENLVTVFMLPLLVGLVVYATVTWRAQVFPRWVSIGFVLLPFLPMVEGLGTAAGGLVLGALGVALWLRSSAAPPAAPVA